MWTILLKLRCLYYCQLHNTHTVKGATQGLAVSTSEYYNVSLLVGDPQPGEFRVSRFGSSLSQYICWIAAGPSHSSLKTSQPVGVGVYDIVVVPQYWPLSEKAKKNNHIVMT
jgi:hypothetical protein